MAGRSSIILLVIAAGAAALSWEVLWQLEASLALGVSARGTAITLSVMMAGMTGGALLMGRWLRDREVRPLVVYGILELVVGLGGAAMKPAFGVLEAVDTAVWTAWPAGAPLVHLLGIALILGPAALAMGATLPVFGMLARQFGGSIARLYAANTFGAVLGTLGMAFVVLPRLGVTLSAGLLVCIDVLVFLAAVSMAPPERLAPAPRDTSSQPVTAWRSALLIAAVTGFSTFALEVAWFRALRAAFRSTTDSFAIMLASVLLPLALAAHLAPKLRKDGTKLGRVLGGAAVLILLATPIVERFDSIVLTQGNYLWVALPARFAQSLFILGPPILLLGIALPWLLDEQQTAKRWAGIYAANTLGAVAGSLGTAWILLPTLGFALTARVVGVLVGVVALLQVRKARLPVAVGLVVSFGLAAFFETGVGRTRTLARTLDDQVALLDFEEGPDATISAVEYENGNRALIIDGFQASSEFGGLAYMTWMGTLPMVLHPAPTDGLVICFGTGQTADAMRKEGIANLDVVDLNEAVFRFARHFPTNEGVLDAPHVHPIVMDGRAWLRRTEKQYDVITLEPMPPFFAGVNALYSAEFYEAAKLRLREGGTIAQWVPFHLMSPPDAASIAAAFQQVFPDAALWIEPSGSNGILLGRAGTPAEPLGTSWPGLSRFAEGRLLDAAGIRQGLALGPTQLQRYIGAHPPVTDDNQLLAYTGVVGRIQAYGGGLEPHVPFIRAAQHP